MALEKSRLNSLLNCLIAFEKADNVEDKFSQFEPIQKNLSIIYESTEESMIIYAKLLELSGLIKNQTIRSLENGISSNRYIAISKRDAKWIRADLSSKMLNCLSMLIIVFLLLMTLLYGNDWRPESILFVVACCAFIWILGVWKANKYFEARKERLSNWEKNILAKYSPSCLEWAPWDDPEINAEDFDRFIQRRRYYYRH